MLSRGWLGKAIRTLMFETKYYNRYAKREMVERNIVALELMGTFDLVFTLLFLLISPHFSSVFQATWHYWIMVPVFVVFTVAAFIYARQKHKNYILVQATGTLFSIVLVALLINIGIFANPGEPDMLMGFLLVILPLVFANTEWIIVSIVILGGAVYCIFSDIFKDPSVSQYDIFNTVLSMVLSLTVLAYNSGLRAKGFIAREKYKTLSRMDLLTELLNKKSYELWCQKLLNEREKDEPCALAIFDLDNFKQINDTYGHIIGDKVLEIVGRILSERFQNDCFVGRIGGDEFSAFTCSKGGAIFFEERAGDVVERVRELSWKELKIEATISVGISFSDGEVSDYMEMYFDADKALYEYKRSKKENRIAVAVSE